MNENKALVPVPQRVETALLAREDTLRSILPATMPVQRFIKTAVIAISKNPDLQRCTFDSLVVAIIEAAEAGIEPTGSLSRGWLVPFSDKGVTKAQLIIGWMGLIDLARDSGDVTKIVARVVYEGDEFLVEQGSTERIVHVPKYETEDPTKITAAYMVATLTDGSTVHEVMTKSQIDGVRSRAKARNGPAWTDSYPEMARKTVVRRGVKYLPLTPKARHAIERDDEHEFGEATPPPPPNGKTLSVKESLRAEIEAKVIELPPAEPIPPEVYEKYVNPEEIAEGARAILVEPPSDKCAEVSPYGDGLVCDRAKGHKGSHLNGDGKAADRVAW